MNILLSRLSAGPSVLPFEDLRGMTSVLLLGGSAVLLCVALYLLHRHPAQHAVYSAHLRSAK